MSVAEEPEEVEIEIFGLNGIDGGRGSDGLHRDSANSKSVLGLFIILNAAGRCVLRSSGCGWGVEVVLVDRVGCRLITELNPLSCSRSISTRGAGWPVLTRQSRQYYVLRPHKCDGRAVREAEIEDKERERRREKGAERGVEEEKAEKGRK